MTPRYIPAVRTPASPAEMLAAFAHRAPELSRPSLLTLLAQWALETGRGASEWCFNTGNVKSRPDGSDGRSWTFFPTCDEYLKPEHAASLVAKAKPRTDGKPGLDAVLTGKKQSDGDVQVVFYPSNPANCFRAYDTRDEGVADYLATMRKRFANAWPAVENGDPVQFAHLLKVAHYYTASEQGYANALAQHYRQLDIETQPAIDIGDALERLGYSRCGVEAFQGDHPPLKVDGIPGPKTMAAIAKALGEL